MLAAGAWENVLLSRFWPANLPSPSRRFWPRVITNSAELNGMLLEASEGILFLDEIHLLHPRSSTICSWCWISGEST